MAQTTNMENEQDGQTVGGIYFRSTIELEGGFRYCQDIFLSGVSQEFQADVRGKYRTIWGSRQTNLYARAVQ